MDNSYKLEVLKKTSEANRNLKWATAVMVTVCAVSFLSLWNSLHASWYMERLAIHIEMLENYDSLSKSEDLNLIPEITRNKDGFKDLHNYFHSKKYTKKSLEHNIKILQGIQAHNMGLLTVPFFNIVLDINDLGVFSGASFIVVLFILIYCLEVKYKHLLIATHIISEADDNGDETCLKAILDMNQVFDIPEEKRIIGLSVVKFLSSYLYTLPLITYFAILAHDILTFPLAINLAFNTAIIHLISSILLFSVVVFLTFFAGSRVKVISKAFRNILN